MKVIIPTEWKAIKVKQYTEYLRIHSGEYDTVQRILNTVSCIGNIDIEKLEEVSIHSLKQFYASVMWMNNTYTGKDIKDYTNKKGDIEIKVGDTIYTCEPNITKWTSGMYADIKTVLSSDDIKYNTDKLLACVLYPKGEKYGKTPNADKADNIYNNMDMEAAFTLTVFFYQIYNSLIKDIVRSSTGTVNEQMKNLLEEITT
jgi:hypothetical protein